MEKTVPLRREVDPKYTWNARSVFESARDWEAALQDVVECRIPEFTAYQGRLADGAATVAEAFEALNELVKQGEHVLTYGFLSYAVDTEDQNAARMLSRAEGMYSQMLAAIAFFDPELLDIGEDRLREWMEAESRLAVCRHYVENVFRNQEHIRSQEVEELLGMVSEPFSTTSNTGSKLRDADFTFQPTVSSDGETLPVTQGTVEELLKRHDREIRRTAWEHYADTYLAFKNTLAGNLEASVKQNVFFMHARKHRTTLEASLFANNIPKDVFYNLLETFKKHLPLWHRYWRLRREALKVDTLHPYDIWAPLSHYQPAVSYEQSIDWICQGLAPMGEEYVAALRQGALADRWIDVYPNQGKMSGAFSAGSPGTHPFIVLSYTGDISSLSTVAHELGHSMHSYLTWQNQPPMYGEYSMFVAEVASNFHQAMIRAYLLKEKPEPAFQIPLLEEAMENFHRYFFLMPTLARFELDIHERIEQGQGVTADDMNSLMADVFSEGYGGEMHVDRERVGITWAAFQHLYSDYYVYQYATGISGAYALSNRILSGEENAVEAYLNFLKAGNSRYPLDILKEAGVDLTTPQPVEEAFNALSGMIDRLETLVRNSPHVQT